MDASGEQRVPAMHGLPLQDLLPHLLVVTVVDFNDVGHVWSGEVVVTPAPPAAHAWFISTTN